jgi:signal transduction histidine kinase
LQSQKNKNLNSGTLSLFASILCVFIADTLNSARLINITTNFALLSDCLYSGFALFLSFFLVLRLNILKRRINEWVWLFLAVFLIDLLLSYKFLLSPYYVTDATLAWKVSGTIYMILTVFILALVLSFAFRVIKRKTFWFCNLLILLFVSDFAIRYQDAFSDATTFSWAEMGWCSSFVGLSWLLHFTKSKSLFIPQPLLLAPNISIRSLLTLFICGSNSLLLAGILFVKLTAFKNAIDISTMLLLLFLFWTVANEFSIWLANDLSNTLKHMFKSKEHLANNGIVQFNLEQVSAKNSIFEISKILDSYNELAIQTNKMMDIVTETNKRATMSEIAFQVSHDIRSPLAALDIAVKSIPEIPEQNRVFIRSACGRIRDIANNLIQQNPKASSGSAAKDNYLVNQNEKSIQLLSSLIDRLISEKRMQFRSMIDIEIDSALNEKSYGIFSEVHTREFMRLLSNLLNNSVEALENKGRVTVSLYQSENYAVISIIDNGQGISPEIINKLGQRGETFGKENGSGLGLYHARKTIESWHGQLKIDSKPHIGTTINIMLPLAKTAPWFVESLHISATSFVVILDDDISIHQIWDSRLEKANVKNHGVEILHFSTPNQLILWAQENINNLLRTHFLIDYAFIGSKQVGLDIIETLEIQSRSILVTSHFEEAGLRERCEQLGLRLIPKDMAGFVPIIIEEEQKADAVLIDDDALVHLSWEHCAKSKQIVLALFSTAEEFINVSHKFARNVSVYLDVRLANGIRGEVVAKQLSELGFENIYLATGYEPTDFENLPFIKGIIDKYPPF